VWQTRAFIVLKTARTEMVKAKKYLHINLVVLEKKFLSLSKELLAVKNTATFLLEPYISHA
jgi:hypothetical protein